MYYFWYDEPLTGIFLDRKRAHFLEKIRKHSLFGTKEIKWHNFPEKRARWRSRVLDFFQDSWIRVNAMKFSLVEVNIDVDKNCWEHIFRNLQYLERRMHCIQFWTYPNLKVLSGWTRFKAISKMQGNIALWQFLTGNFSYIRRIYRCFTDFFLTGLVDEKTVF